MKPFCSLALATVLGLPVVAAAQSNPFAGRWDITITTPNGSYPDWMELTMKDGQPAVRIQPRGGGVHPATNVKVEGSHLTLALDPATAKQPATLWDLTVAADRLSGTQKRGNGPAFQIAGVRAPELKRPEPAAWSAPEPLFNGKDLSGWEPTSPTAHSRWTVQDGLLVNEKAGANLRTTKTFNDFKLHVEFNCPKNGNSGVYLRGRYEVQIEYEPVDENDAFHAIGSIYGFIAPKPGPPRTPGVWETYDITLVGRTVTVVRDGVTTIDHQEMPGITGGALDSNEAEPGPIYIQGDHTGGLKFRNITIASAK